MIHPFKMFLVIDEPPVYGGLEKTSVPPKLGLMSLPVLQLHWACDRGTPSWVTNTSMAVTAVSLLFPPPHPTLRVTSVSARLLLAHLPSAFISSFGFLFLSFSLFLTPKVLICFFFLPKPCFPHAWILLSLVLIESCGPRVRTQSSTLGCPQLAPVSRRSSQNAFRDSVTRTL